MPILATNKKAYFDYEILETFEAGIILSGPEVKSAKRGQIDLTGGYIVLDKNKVPWLMNVKIAPYPPAAQIQENYQPDQPRKLLLKKKEIDYLIGKSQIKGLTILPLRVYTKGSLVKIEIGVARGKKKFDKRGKIKERELKRKIGQMMRYKV